MRAAPSTLMLIDRLAKLLPTHTRRSETAQAFQQFSTPPGLAFVASVAASLSTDDRVLEPSAGTGMLAVYPTLVGAELMLNELAERSEEHTSELQSLMRNSYAVFC